jgi:hypothetical protein
MRTSERQGRSVLQKNTHVITDTITVQIAHTIEELTTEWEKLADSASFFLQKSYLAAIEAVPPSGMRFAYLTFFEDEMPIGIAYAQIFKFSTYESLKHHKSFKEKTTFWQELKFWAAKQVEFYSIVCGNVLLTGEYGFYFENKKENTFHLVTKGLEILRKELQQKGIKASVTLFKDFYENNQLPIENTAFGAYQIQPTMVLKLQPEWKKFDDYLGAMASKYRVRAKRALKKGEEIFKEELNLDALQQHETLMFDLYQQIIESAGFNGIALKSNYFINLKQQLGDDFKVIGYFLEGELVGFYTVFMTEKVLESHYLGINQVQNRECQIYLNMLYDMVRMAIYHEKTHLALARTALEIKSSIGAEPHELFFYMKHHNFVLNPFIQFLFNWFYKKEEWVQRQPFK